MKTFIENLPNNPIKTKIAIAFNHFMAGRTMHFENGHEITTQYGFKNAVLTDLKGTMTAKEIDKVIADYNKKNVTPDAYRELAKQLDELQYEDFKRRQLDNFKQKHPVKYIIAKLQKRI